MDIKYKNTIAKIQRETVSLVSDMGLKIPEGKDYDKGFNPLSLEGQYSNIKMSALDYSNTSSKKFASYNVNGEDIPYLLEQTKLVMQTEFEKKVKTEDEFVFHKEQYPKYKIYEGFKIPAKEGSVAKVNTFVVAYCPKMNYPMQVTISNYKAPLAQNKLGVDTSKISDKVEVTIRLTMKEWYNFIYKNNAIYERFLDKSFENAYMFWESLK